MARAQKIEASIKFDPGRFELKSEEWKEIDAEILKRAAEKIRKGSQAIWEFSNEMGALVRARIDKKIVKMTIENHDCIVVNGPEEGMTFSSDGHVGTKRIYSHAHRSEINIYPLHFEDIPIYETIRGKKIWIYGDNLISYLKYRDTVDAEMIMLLGGDK